MCNVRKGLSWRAMGKFQLITAWVYYIAQGLSLSPLHHLNMTYHWKRHTSPIHNHHHCFQRVKSLTLLVNLYELSSDNSHEMSVIFFYFFFFIFFKASASVLKWCIDGCSEHLKMQDHYTDIISTSWHQPKEASFERVKFRAGKFENPVIWLFDANLIRLKAYQREI